MMAALNRRSNLEQDAALDPEAVAELERLLAQYGLGEDDPTLTADDVDRYLLPASMPDSALDTLGSQGVSSYR